MKLEFKCLRLCEIADFKKAQELVGKGVQICPNFSKTVFDTMRKRQMILLLGPAQDGLQAIEILLNAPGFPQDEERAKIFANMFMETLQDIFFAPENVLSFIYRLEEGGLCCVAVILPLKEANGRVPNAEKYLHKRKAGSLSEPLQDRIEGVLSEQFPEIELSHEHNITDKKALGYTDYLINYQAKPYQKDYDQVQPYNTPDVDSQVQTIAPIRDIKKITDETITYFTLGPEQLTFEQSQKRNGAVTEEMLMKKVDDYLERYHGTLHIDDRAVISSRVRRALFGNYILDPLIDDDKISDIMVLAPDDIRVKIGAKRYTSNLKFLNAKDYKRFIESLAIRNDLDIYNNAINVFSDTRTNAKYRMRMNITTPHINSSDYPYFHIRKIAKEKRGFQYLLDNQMLDETIAEYLIDRARNGAGMIFTGKGASGKTTLMNALLDKIPFTSSGLVIQESEELFSNVHPHLMFEHITTNDRNEHMRYDLQDLARNGLLTDLDYFVIGEVKGAEAKYFINAADTGHKCWCSVHSPSSTDAIDKLADYVMYESSYSKEESLYMLKSLGTVIFMKNFKVCEISELAGWDKKEKQLKYRLVYRRPGVFIEDE